MADGTQDTTRARRGRRATNIVLGDELDDRLRAIAIVERKSKSEIVREAVERYHAGLPSHRQVAIARVRTLDAERRSLINRAIEQGAA